MASAVEPQALPRRETFRFRAVIRYIVLAAIYFWVGVLLMLVALRGATDRAFLSAAFFIGLFGLAFALYSTTRIVVDEEGVTLMGFRSALTLPFSDIVKVDVKEGLSGLTNYEIVSRHGMLSFNSLFENHQRLLDLIVERAGLVARA
jgi:hypothetical protein